MDSVWENSPVNLGKAQKWIFEQDADIVVLPEMFNSGFTMQPERVAVSVDSVEVAWLKETATQSHSAIVCSMAVCEGGNYYNRLYFVKPCGEVLTYNKRHLFRMGLEHEHYTSGTERLMVEYKGWRILPLVCYDLRFPVYSRCQNECDLMIYVANWPKSRALAWERLLRARAIENQCYVAGVNRVGVDPKVDYSGNSMIVDFFGDSISEAQPSVEQTVKAEICLDKLNEYRTKFPAYLDVDKFTIEL